MAITTPALVAETAGAPFTTRLVDHRDVGPGDVKISIQYAGICHSDIHQVRQEWGPAIFPMVPGHEIAGIVSAVGADVVDVKVGDRVGVGCMVDSCGSCEFCLDGFEQHCTRGAVMTYNGTGYDGVPTKGGYAQSIVVADRFVCAIPDGISLAEAAPLMCAGVTTYSPLRRWGVGPGSRVGVVGLGGLGHMGVKIAVALGADVTVFSRTSDKATDAEKLGARAHVATSDPKALRSLSGQFDLVLNTVSATIDIQAYLRLVKARGVLVNVGLPAENYSVRPNLLVGTSKVIAGSNIGGIPETREMLAFCAANGIGAQIETIDAADVDAAYERVVAGDVHYRAVIDVSTINVSG